jgi:hypothetical protein
MYDGGRPSPVTLHKQRNTDNSGYLHGRLMLPVKPNVLSRYAQTYRGPTSWSGLDRQAIIFSGM